jgi:hypothetical protein
MRLYHIGEGLEEGMVLVPGYRKLETLVEPFLMALDRGEDAFSLMLIESRYFRAVMRRSKLREWSNYVKWSTEAVFERVRTQEFPDCPGRLASLYYYGDRGLSLRLYREDYPGPADREGVGLYEVEVEDEAPRAFDMALYVEAYAAMEEGHDLPSVRDCARRYFGGCRTAEPVVELLSDRKATVLRELELPD